MPGWEERTLAVKTASPCSLVSFLAPGKGTLKSFGSTPTRTQRERSGPLSGHSLNACHQAGRPGRGPPGAVPLEVATRGAARPGAAGSGDSRKEGHKSSLRPHLRCRPLLPASGTDRWAGSNVSPPWRRKPQLPQVHTDGKRGRMCQSIWGF